MLNAADVKLETETIRCLKQGDVKAFERIFKLYYPRVYKFALATLYDKNFAEDITQSVFIALWENKEKVDEDKNIGSFLFTIAKNKVYRQTERLILEHKHQEYLREKTPEADSIEEELQKRFLEKIIYDIIDELPKARREIFLLSRKNGLSNKEIALKLDVSGKTVDTQIRRSIIYLKERMKYVHLFIPLLFQVLRK